MSRRAIDQSLAPNPDMMAVQTWLDRYPAKSRSAYEGDWMAFFRKLGKKRLASVSPNDVLDFAKSADTQAVRKRRLSAIRMYFNSAVEQGKLANNPTLDLRLPSVEMKPRELRSLSEDEVADTIDAAEKTRDRLILLLLYRGLTGPEVRGLTWANVIDVEGNPALRVSGPHARVLPIDEELARAIDLHRAESLAEPERMMLLSKFGPVSEKTVNRIVSECGEKVGVAHANPSTLRHSFAQHALARGMPMELVQLHLGHRQMKTTSDHLAALARQHPELSSQRFNKAGASHLLALEPSAHRAVAAAQIMSDEQFANAAQQLRDTGPRSQHLRLTLMQRVLTEIARRETAGEPPPPGASILPVLVPLDTTQFAVLFDVLDPARQKMRERLADPASGREAEFYREQLQALDALAGVLRHFDPATVRQAPTPRPAAIPPPAPIRDPVPSARAKLPKFKPRPSPAAEAKAEPTTEQTSKPGPKITRLPARRARGLR